MPLILCDHKSRLVKKIAEELGADMMKISKFFSKEPVDLSDYGKIYIFSQYLLIKKLPKNLVNFIDINKEQLKDAQYIFPFSYVWNAGPPSDYLMGEISNWKYRARVNVGADTIYIVGSENDDEYAGFLSRLIDVDVGRPAELLRSDAKLIIYLYNRGSNYLSKLDSSAGGRLMGIIIMIPFVIGLFTGSGLVISFLYILPTVVAFLLFVAAGDYMKWFYPPQLVIKRIYKPSGEYRDVPHMRETGMMLFAAGTAVVLLIFISIMLFATGVLKTPFI